MSDYPTPPPTSSPKDDLKHDYHAAHDFRQQDHHDHTAVQHRPAQETYYHSAPNSPKHTHVALYQNPISALPEQGIYQPHTNSPKHFYGPPPNLPHTQSDHIYDSRPGGHIDQFHQKPLEQPAKQYSVDTIPYIRPSSGQKRRTPPPRPLYFSPTNKPPSPYNAARPKPRPGFVQRLKDKLTRWFRGLMRWAKKNPIKAGIASFVPVMLGVAGVKAFAGLGGVTRHIFDKVETAMGGGEYGKKRKPTEKKFWDYGLDHFVGFNGTKGGPLDGAMRILQMFMNHYAKLTPSAVPRAAVCITNFTTPKPEEHKT